MEEASRVTQQAAVAALLSRLLLGVDVYRSIWVRRVNRGATDAVNQAAVSQVVTEYLWEAGELAESIGPRSIRNRVHRALAGKGCSTTTLHWMIAAFDMTQEHANELFQTLSGSLQLHELASVTTFPDLPAGQHVTRSLNELHVIGADRLPQRHRTVQVVESLVDGFQTYPYRFDTPSARVTVEEGGTPSPVIPMGGGLWGVWITLSAPLAKGRTRSLNYETRYSYHHQPAPEFRRGARARVESVNLRVRFHPLALPQRVFWCTWTDSETPDSEDAVELDVEHSTEHFLTLMEGTLVGFRWEW